MMLSFEPLLILVLHPIVFAGILHRFRQWLPTFCQKFVWKRLPASRLIDIFEYVKRLIYFSLYTLMLKYFLLPKSSLNDKQYFRKCLMFWIFGLQADMGNLLFTNFKAQYCVHDFRVIMCKRWQNRIERQNLCIVVSDNRHLELCKFVWPRFFIVRYEVME